MSFLKNYFYFLFFSIMLWSCAERGGHHSNLDSFNRYLSYNVVETTHFVFISKDIDIPTLRQLADVSENIYYSVSYELGNSYSFSKPYKIFVYSQVYEKFSDIGDEEDAKVIFSTNTPASISGVIASVMLRDIVGDCLDLYPILHYGYKIYHERKSSLAIENYYLSIISDLLKEALNPFYILDLLNPQDLTPPVLDRYYALSSSMIKFLIERYGQFKFSIFVNELKKCSAFYDTIEKVYLFYPGEFKKDYLDYIKGYDR